MQTGDIYYFGYDGPDEYGFYPDGIKEENFNNMILVVDTTNDIGRNMFLPFPLYYSGWFYYYGNGEYGIAPTKEEAEKVYSDGDFPGNEEKTLKMNIGNEITEYHNNLDYVGVYSKNNDIVTITYNEENNEFVLKATGTGETTVTVEYSTDTSDWIVQKTFIIVVEKPEFASKEITLSAGESAVPTFKNLYSDDFVLTSSNPDVAMVENGVVYGLSKGNTTLTATAGDVTIDCKIKVKNNPKIVNNQGEKVKTVTIRKGKKITLKLQGKVKEIKNLYTNSTKAKIISKKNTDRIKIKGLKKGTSKVYVTVNNVKIIPIKVKVR